MWPRAGKNQQSYFDIGVTALVVGSVVSGSFLLSHITHGTLKSFSAQLSFSLSIGLALMVILGLLERIAPACPHKSINGWTLNLRIACLLFSAIALSGIIGASLSFALVSRLGTGWIDLRSSGGGGIPIVAAFFVSILISDFFYYWHHRLQHKIPFLWQQHKVHHMDEQMNASTRGRVDWGEAFVSIITSTIPATIIFKLEPVTAGTVGGIVAVVLEAWVVFYHSNIKLSLGRASVLVVCPQVHRIHHSRLLEHRDRNFAGYFPIWDVLFGTYCPPTYNEFPPTGVEEERQVASFSEAVAVPFRGWANIFLQWQRRRVALLH